MPVPSPEQQQKVFNSLAELYNTLVASKGVAGIVKQSIHYACYCKMTGKLEEYEEEVRFLSTPSKQIEGFVKTREEVEAMIAEEMEAEEPAPKPEAKAKGRSKG